jgi:ribonucleoside-diphosphate reductase alpha chain
MKKVQLTGEALKIATARYFMDGEDWEACSLRAADVVSAAEVTNRNKIRDEFFEMIACMDFMPGGRILRNCGRPRGSLFNCYHLPIGDSIEEIGQFIKDSLILWSDGGGVGCNFTPLRPRGDTILGKGGTSSGAVSFIAAADAVADTIESGGSRRAAAIAHMDVSHPEVMDFIDAKLVHGRLSHFNISVSVNEKFLEAVERDDDWTFKFKAKEYGKVKAKVVWDKIVQNMIESAEPGLLNWDNFQKNNSYYFEPVLGTNPCGETTLGPYGVCDLGSLVLPNFITGSINTNWIKLEKTIELAVRFLDNIIEVNKYTLKDIDINAHKSRRVGIGVMGVADYLFAKKIRYGSEKAVIELERLMRFIRDKAYEASIKLAQEKGAFPAFDPIPHGKASFIRKLPASMRLDIKKHGIRNCTLMALAPTGTISLIAEKTSGVEPLFSRAYMRRDRVGERMYIHPIYEEAVKNDEELPEWFVDAFDLTPEDHFEVQAAMQKYCDGSVSKTINLPADTTDAQLSELLLEYVRDLKGCTVYRDGSRDGQILSRLPDKEVRKFIKEQKTNTGEEIIIENNFVKEDVVCATGSCEI